MNIKGKRIHKNDLRTRRQQEYRKQNPYWFIDPSILREVLLAEGVLATSFDEPDYARGHVIVDGSVSPIPKELEA